MQLTPEQKSTYLKDSGKCPWCRSADIEGMTRHEEDGDWHSHQIDCLACGKSWLDIYILNDVHEV